MKLLKDVGHFDPPFPWFWDIASLWYRN